MLRFQGKDRARSTPGYLETLDIKKIGLMFHCFLLVSCPRINWLGKALLQLLLSLSRPWLLHWTSPSRMTELCVQGGPCAIIWTRPRTCGQVNSWSLSRSRRISVKILSRPLFLMHCANRLTLLSHRFHNNKLWVGKMKPACATQFPACLLLGGRVAGKICSSWQCNHFCACTIA